MIKHLIVSFLSIFCVTTMLLPASRLDNAIVQQQVSPIHPPANPPLHMPLILDIQGVVRCPARIHRLNLGKIQVVTFKDGSSGKQKKLPGATVYEPVSVEVELAPALHIMRWFKRLRNGKAERKTVTIGVPVEPQMEVKVNLWYAWPSQIAFNPRTEGMATVVIQFQCEQIEVEFPKGK
jgi:hypothetical protein